MTKNFDTLPYLRPILLNVVRMLRLISITLSLIVLAVMLAGAGVLWIFWTYGKGLPDYQQLANYEPPVVTRVHAGNGALLAEYASEKGGSLFRLKLSTATDSSFYFRRG